MKSTPLKAHLVVVSIMKFHYFTLFCKSVWKKWLAHLHLYLSLTYKQEIEYNSYDWILFIKLFIYQIVPLS